MAVELTNNSVTIPTGCPITELFQILWALRVGTPARCKQFASELKGHGDI